MESRVNALEECFKEAEKRLDEVDKKVDAVFQEAEDVKNGGKGGAYAYPFNLPDSPVKKIKSIRSSSSESSQEAHESKLIPKVSQTLKSFHAIKDEYKSLVTEVCTPNACGNFSPLPINESNQPFLQIDELKSAQTAAMTEILGQLEAATGDMDKLKHILGEHAAKTEKLEWSV